MDDYKKPIIITLIIFVALLLYGRFGAPIPVSISSVVSNKNDLFTVTGQGKVSVIPDEAQVRVGMQVTSTTVAEGQNQVNHKINMLLDQLKSKGINKEDIKTENYSIYPTQDNQTNKITGYSISSNLVITVKDLSNVNDVIDTSTKAGLNSVGGVEFILSDKKREEVMSEARKDAINQAKKKAENLSKLSGIHLGKLVNVQEDQGNIPQPIVMNAMAKDMPERTDTSTTVAPGSTDITLLVTLSYETR